jgi:DNA-binding SARP family transcriptional activator/tetratricopeptide (TPR) repeat protein
MAARLRLTLLGGFGAHLGSGEPAALPGQKTRALLAFLALHAGRPQPRAKLMALLWGESPDRQAAQSLRRALYLIRRALGPEAGALVIDGDTVSLNVAGLEVDVLELERLTAGDTPEDLERATAFHRGELLEGLDAASSQFEGWLRDERLRVFEMTIQGAAKLLAHHLRVGQYEAAARTAAHVVALDPAQEAVHRALMRLHAEHGRRAAALRQYQVCVDALRRELGTEPEPETTELYLEILRAAAPAGAAAGAGPDEPRRPAGEIPLIGRDAELVALRHALDEACQGRGRLVVISGEAGIGKTRLLAELRAEAAARNMRVLLGHCHQTEQVLPFRPIIECLRAGGLAADSALLAELSPATRTDLARLLPELADPSEAPGAGAAPLTWLFEALLALLERAAAREPIVLMFEDVHWADEMTARWLAFAGRGFPGLRALLAVTMRDEEVEDAPTLAMALGELAGAPGVLRLGLEPLSEQGTRDLVATLSRARERAGRAVSTQSGVWRISDGNPFVIVEAVREILERGGAALIEEGGVPHRVRELIEVRMRRLDEPIRHVMTVAAVAGQPVTLDLLSRAAGMGERATAEAVEQLVRRRILHGVEERLDFAHDRIRQTAYQAVLPARRRALHRAVGEALEAATSGPRADLEDRLAHHFSQAGVADRAVAYLARFAETARRRNALDEATRSLERALAMVDELGDAERDRVRLDLLVRKAFLLALGNRHREALALLAPHRDLVEFLGDPAAAGPYHFRLGMSCAQLGDAEEAERLGRRTVEEGTRARDTTTIGLGHHLLAFRAHLGGHRFREGAEHARQAVAHLEEAGETHYRGLAYWVLSHHLLYLGRFGPALEAVGRVEAIAERLREPRLYSFGAVRGFILASRGEWEEAVRHGERAVARAVDPVSAAVALSALGYAHAQGGDAERAVSALREGRDNVRRLYLSRATEARFGAFLADAYLLKGDAAEARAVALEALEFGREGGYEWGEVWAERALGRAAHALGDPAAGVTHLRAARERFAALEAAFETARTAFHLAEALPAIGDAPAAATAARQARAGFAALDVPIWTARAAELARRLASP